MTETLPVLHRLAYWLDHKGLFDGVLRKRAASVLRKARIVEYVGPGKTYIDVGAGLGHIAEGIVTVAGEGTRYVAVEPGKRASVRVRRRLTGPGVQGKAVFLKAEGQRLPVRDGSADGLLLVFVLHHAAPNVQGGIFAEARRVLKDGGLLFLVEDTPLTPEEYERNVHWDRRVNFEPEHLGHYYKAPDEWLTYLAGWGFGLVETAYFHDRSRRKSEGVIRHTSFIFRKMPAPEQPPRSEDRDYAAAVPAGSTSPT